MRTTTPRWRNRAAAATLSAALFLSGLSAMTVAQEDPTPDPAEPEATPFVNEGTWVPHLEAPDLMFQASREPGWAGWYLDVDRDLIPVMMWTEDLDEAGALLAEIFGDDATFEVRAAERTWAELVEIADKISDMRPEFDDREILLVETEYNVKRNRVDVGVKATEEKLAVAEQMLEAFGDAVKVRRVNVPQFDS